MVVIRIWEGLGNQLFQYAYGRALELRTGQKVCFDIERCFAQQLEGKRIQRKYELDKFRVRVRDYSKTKSIFFFLKQSNVVENLLYFYAKECIFPIRFIQEKDTLYKDYLKDVSGCCYLMGWFQNEQYFKEYRDILLREIVPREKIRISKSLKDSLNNRNTVSIHVRRGDYLKNNNVLPLFYYKHAIKYMEDKVLNPLFLVFSDDIQWVKNNMDFQSEVIYVSQESHLEAYEELFVMSRCKHNVIANSTFSWWGAWLNTNKDKIVVGPKVWNNGAKDQDNIMPSEWIRVW